LADELTDLVPVEEKTAALSAKLDLDTRARLVPG
jgi:hypothetical protein